MWQERSVRAGAHTLTANDVLELARLIPPGLPRRSSGREDPRPRDCRRIREDRQGGQHRAAAAAPGCVGQIEVSLAVETSIDLRIIGQGWPWVGWRVGTGGTRFHGASVVASGSRPGPFTAVH